VTAVHDLAERPLRRVAERNEQGSVAVFGKAKKFPGECRIRICLAVHQWTLRCPVSPKRTFVDELGPPNMVLRADQTALAVLDLLPQQAL
jgi:hypothetical protein